MIDVASTYPERLGDFFTIHFAVHVVFELVTAVGKSAILARLVLAPLWLMHVDIRVVVDVALSEFIHSLQLRLFLFSFGHFLFFLKF